MTASRPAVRKRAATAAGSASTAGAAGAAGAVKAAGITANIGKAGKAKAANPAGITETTGSAGTARTKGGARPGATPAPRARPAPPPAAGDLRQRILEASVALLETDGLAALSMREVARRAGVTHQAPYHHFADRESILAELVGEGFGELARRLERANDRAATLGPRIALREAGEAYVGFALERPGVFRIMFRPEVCDLGRFPAAQAAGERAFEALGRLVRIVHGAFDETLASMHWAQVHGLACLLVDGGLGAKMPGARERRAHVRETLARFADYVTGAAPPARPAPA